jgi:cytochrome P450
MRETRKAHEQLLGFLQAQVRDRKANVQGQDGEDSNDIDLFTMLVKANESESEKLRLDDQELVRILVACFVFAE